MGFGLIWGLIAAGIAGWLTGLIMKGKGYGILGDLLIGIVGGWLGGFLFGRWGGLFGHIAVATIGAVILVAVVRLLKRA